MPDHGDYATIFFSGGRILPDAGSTPASSTEVRSSGIL
jgi:hypothetical protein